jgi:hypothetical protein
MQSYRYFVSQSSEFCRHNPLCCFSMNVYCCYLFRYRLSPETFGYTFVLGEWKYNSKHSLTSPLDGGEWTASRPGGFTSRERAPSTHWIGGLVGSRASLNLVRKRKLPSSRWESNSDHPIVQPVSQRTTKLAKLVTTSDGHRGDREFRFSVNKTARCRDSGPNVAV